MHSYALKYSFHLTCDVVLKGAPLIFFMNDDFGHGVPLAAYNQKCYGLLSIQLDIITIFITSVMIFSYSKALFPFGFFFYPLLRIIPLHILSKDQ